jgi:hypothetical protein
LKKYVFIIVIFLLNWQFVVGQNKSIPLKKYNKGKLYVLVGWNWERYTQSDIHFSGPNHDFVLENVKAEDRPAKFTADLYLNPKNLSIPQTNLKIGYFFHHHWNLAFGIDHMKYVVIQNQKVGINGTINEQNFYDGTYNNQNIFLYRRFLEYEHTDGLNYTYFEINRVDRILQSKFFDINFTEGLAFGPIIPRSDVVFLSKQEWDKYHLAGYGTSLKVAANLTFFNYFYIQSEAKGGFVHLPSVKTTPNKADNASQHFFYFQNNIVFGAIFPIVKKEKRMPSANK